MRVPGGNVEVFDRHLLRQRRARIADRIAGCDFLLSRLTEDFIDRLNVINREFSVVLNLGAHHGLLSRALRSLDQIGAIIDVDASPAMLTHCDGLCICADEEFLPIAPASLDLVVSGLSLQFVNDLPGALAQIRASLKPDGLLLAGLLGGRTLHELRDAFLRAEAEMDGGASPRVAPFADVRQLGALMQRAGFALPVVDGDTVCVTYETPLALMHELRNMGAGNVMSDRARTPLHRATLFRAVEIYQERYGLADGRVSATFEIITLTGWAPHKSQQQPLRPGSAQTSLADALGSVEQSAGEKAGGGHQGGGS